MLPPSTYLVVQDGRKYFDNISFIQGVAAEEAPAWATTIDGAPAATVYRTSELPKLRNSYESNVSLR
jgi:hypothetical protein